MSVIVNPFGFGAAPLVFSSVFSVSVGAGGPDNGWNGYSVRQFMPAAQLTDAVGTAMRLTFGVPPSVSLVMSTCHVGLKGSGAYDFASAPQTVTFNGGSAGFNQANATGAELRVVSDSFTFNYDGTHDIIISMEMGTGTSNSFMGYTGVTGATVGYKSGSYGTDLVWPSGGFTENSCLVRKIEVA